MCYGIGCIYESYPKGIDFGCVCQKPKHIKQCPVFEDEWAECMETGYEYYFTSDSNYDSDSGSDD